MDKKAEQRKYLHALGLEVWQDKNVQQIQSQMQEPYMPEEMLTEVNIVSDVKNKINITDQSTSQFTKTWDELAAEVKACELCPLHETRIQTVFGAGSKNADLMFIGEAPGANEDKQGEPFVGRAGKLLTSMLKSIDLDREQVYIGNVLKCRPPQNRDPNAQEVKLCTGYLKKQIALVKPKLIVAVGRIAAQFLLGTDDSMAKLRGHTYTYDYGSAKVPLVVIYHPAYLLRSPREKRKAYADMLMIQNRITN